MTKTKLGFLLGVGCLLGSAMCQYDPHPKSGDMLCGTGDKRCPSGYTCRPQDNLCYRTEDLPVPPATGGTTAGGAGTTAAISSPPATGGQGGGLTVTNTSLPPAGGSVTTSVSQAGGGSTSLPPVGGSTIIPVGGSSLITSVGGAGGTIIPLGGRTLIIPVGGGGSSSSRLVLGGAILGGLSLPVAGAAGGAGGVSSSSVSIVPTGTTVTFTSGKAVGAMTGYGWIAMGAAASVSDPTCGTEKFTSTMACSGFTWSTQNALCMTASIPALPKDPTSSDYSDNWGVLIGIESNQPRGPLGQSFSSITIALSGLPTTGLRAKVHLKGDPETTDYCTAYTTGAMPFTIFSKTCWDTTTPGKAITAADVPNIDFIGLQVLSDQTAIEVKNLCITGITFFK